MEIIAKQLNNLSEEKYFIKHLEIINPLFPTPMRMTSKEIEVLAGFLSLDGDIVKKDRFGTTARKIIKERLSLSDGGLGNYLKTLRQKELIYKNQYNVLEAKSWLFPESQWQG